MGRARAVSNLVAQAGELVVERDPQRPSGRLLRHGDMDASYVDLADPTHLEFDYLRWMRIVLRAARADRVLHLGGGACALPRALAAEDAGRRHEVCEVNADVLALAREHLGLRRTPGLRVRLVDGREHLAAQPDARWDAVVIDAFEGARIPHHLVTVEALSEVARVSSLALINVVDNRAARVVCRVAAGLGAVYPSSWALGPRVGNTILVGTRSKLDLNRIRALAAADPSPARVTTPGTLASLVGGAPPWRDVQG